MTAIQFPMWTLPIPPNNPFFFDEAGPQPRDGDDIENAEQAPPEEPPPTNGGTP